MLATLPAVLAVIFVKLTSTPEDANVGGGLLLLVAVPLGLALAAVHLRASRRR